MNVKRYWVHGAYTKATLPWVLVFNREDHTEAEILVGEFAREGDARFAALAMNAHVDLLSACNSALHWCKQDADNQDGYPTQEMMDARVEELQAAVRQGEGTAV